MVAANDDCKTCEKCRFVERIAQYLESAAQDGSEEWWHDVGPLISDMHLALTTLHQLWAERQTDTQPRYGLDNAAVAATSLVEICERLTALKPMSESEVAEMDALLGDITREGKG